MSSVFERAQKAADAKKAKQEAEKPKLEVVPKITSGSPTTSSSPSSPGSKKQPVSPERDFQKVSNSISREAIPGGLFKSGKCKQLYDALYSLTRGAIQPQRTVRINKPRLMKLAGIGTRETLWQNLKHLEVVGLIEINVLNGEHGGNEYTVYLPQELNATSSSPSSPSNLAYSYQNLPVVPVVESTSSSPSSNPINIDTLVLPKTSFKTLKYIDDDAPVINLLEKFNGMAQKVTGKDLTKKDLEMLSDLAEILITETVIAAARTGAVSAAVPFMTENLRRRLYSKPRQAGKKEARPKHLDVGKGSGEETSLAPQPQTPLSKEQRENTLNALREAKAADSVFFREFKTYGEIEYTAEDFQWLFEQL